MNIGHMTTRTRTSRRTRDILTLVLGRIWVKVSWRPKEGKANPITEETTPKFSIRCNYIDILKNNS